MHGGDVAGRFHQTRHAQAEIRAVDGDNHIGGKGQSGFGHLADTAFQVEILGRDFDDAHDRQFGHVKQAVQPLPLHRRAANTGKFHAWRQL